jgi:methylenetetrahydrofolate dehydrogenase (NADP+)/methenyltetrahydrofolate cyclohydrolase
MTATLMDGRALAAQLLHHTAQRAAQFHTLQGRRPRLATVLVGNDPASHTYARMKLNRCREVGIESRRINLDATTTTGQLVRVLRELSADDGVNGILLQHAVPAHIDERAAFEAIDPAKDVDGVTKASFASIAFGEADFCSCTPGGIMRLLEAYKVVLRGRRAVVVGRSSILGKPMGMLLLARDATVTYCHSQTDDLAAHIGEADILVAAAGRAELIRGEWIKPGAVVIDAGYHPGNTGDVAFMTAADRATLITPVPGGVGPMTIAVLLAQTLDAAERHSL